MIDLTATAIAENSPEAVKVIVANDVPKDMLERGAVALAAEMKCAAFAVK